jgi:prepilin-type N-terminal cleavage/methylation domain-containing protein/prepilin-type processing-associated H-X9-DG protein
MLVRRRGFTLIELLVVIAIIGILAAMLFPVFARAREAARKIQCLSNVKNIAIAVNMYLVDWDSFPPGNNDQNVTNWVAGLGLGSSKRCETQGGYEQFGWRANPYLRWPVILDEYIKNRDVWRCPSAKLQTGAAFIVPMGPNGNWVQYLTDHEGAWGESAVYYGFGICSTSWPTGWGGAVTDSIAQQQLAGTNILNLSDNSGAANQAFVQSVAYNGGAVGTKSSAVQDPARFVICSDGGGVSDAGSPGTIAYPDICCAECSGVTYWAWGGWPPTDAEYCGGCPGNPSCRDTHGTLDWIRSQTRMKAVTRHLGGSNVGYADGHAKWFNAQAICAMYSEGQIQGIEGYCDGGSKQGYENVCGTPPAGMAWLYDKDPVRYP